ncbi:MAG: ATP-binding cassette domain-containing protein [Candidatus Dadabacteria bacterium]|nr:ATP-binding cassette domain-containing protein [Candidatus Dadabacteria bacterium]NIS09541.1 ATP-binding cassette domain-containing protein [Candidatus Dadabacteria bacterium]NIV42753.1 ATP-binding cassette domain-containing protein [Candidatus Dadabacteria bacterium]NIX16647.1 ATP-binding cassette domain-containing protein [Candidatus Dadabacteria bacterium]NIY23188.1 ATP-binding cassette domain-containing protein [Candidatus Dadabacteria bacterium]
MIELKNITKSYGSAAVINDLSLRIDTGTTTALIGPSGCGKSTTLKLINGLVCPEQGSVIINNLGIDHSDILSLRKKTGYIIQDGGLFPHLTAYQNISILADYLGLEKEDISNRINDLCRLTKFPVDALSRYPVEISGGQKQRVSLMRALMLDPEVLLMDEPLGALDPLIRFDLQNDLKQIFNELHKTVVFVTHDLNEAHFFADKIVLMNEGRIVQEGTLDKFTTDPADCFVTKFINAQRTTFS